jgi:hypothetical protein
MGEISAQYITGGIMKKVKATATTRTSLKQKFAAYRSTASSFIYSLQNPFVTPFFSVKAYETTPTGKKPNAVNVPELLAIVGTAKKLGKIIRLDISGTGDTAQLDVLYADAPAALPAELRGY